MSPDKKRRRVFKPTLLQIIADLESRRASGERITAKDIAEHRNRLLQKSSA